MMNIRLWLLVLFLVGIAALPATPSRAQHADVSRAEHADVSRAEHADVSRAEHAEAPVQVAMGALPGGSPLMLVGTVFRDCSDCPEMVVMPLGDFSMGVAPGEEEAEEVPARFRGRAEPRHKVAVNQAFAVSRYEVTVGEFSRFIQATGRKMDGCWLSSNRQWKLLEERNWRLPGYGQTDHDPVVCVSWDDARAYVDWLSGALKQRYRLLSESEWEYVTRTGTATPRPWGKAIGRNYANCQGCGSRWDGQRPAPVGSFSVNRFGLFDMLGNVAEWVEDCWHDNYKDAPAEGVAWTTGSCEFHVIRGGSWVDQPRNVRAAQRDRDTPGMRSVFLGFRIARNITP
ncbi:MAG: formylglycine-generating enzyme family protein [Rhodospirillaceae bacterium]